jgi:hypothetical protein
MNGAERHICRYGTEIPVATKMSILRPSCYAKFKPLIDSIYDRFESQYHTEEKLTLGKAELEEYLLSVIRKNIEASKAVGLTKSLDLFALGVDSLQANRIRNVIQSQIELRGVVLGQNSEFLHVFLNDICVDYVVVVYEYPSVEKYVLQRADGGVSH